jgi:hypothetical protein
VNHHLFAGADGGTANLGEDSGAIAARDSDFRGGGRIVFAAGEKVGQDAAFGFGFEIGE